jgi:hypothetical protein
MRIIHVYKPGSFGFADYIRAIYSISDLAKARGYEYSVAFNHPIGEFFDVDRTPYETTVTCYKVLLVMMEQQTPLIVLESNHTEFSIPATVGLIQNYIKPLPFLTELVDRKMAALGLAKGKFMILHARFGDSDTVCDHEFIRRIKGSLRIMRVQKMPILLLSSSRLITSAFIATATTATASTASTASVVVTGFTPQHTTASGPMLDTMIEFYMMAQAKKIYSISGGSFGTGKSGFSYWASKMFGVPFTHFD